jgi:hypothetical protein
LDPQHGALHAEENVMNMAGVPWIALESLQPHRCLQTAWLLYGWIEREHVLNMNACAEWWMRAMGISAGQFKASRRGSLGIALPPVEPQVLIHEGDSTSTSSNARTAAAGNSRSMPPSSGGRWSKGS